MRFFRVLFIGLVLCAGRVHADAPDTYGARHAARRSGDFTRVVAQGEFLWNRAITREEKRDLYLGELSSGQKHLACSMSRVLPDRDGAFERQVANVLSDLSGARNRTHLLRILTTSTECPRRIIETVAKPVPHLTAIPVDAGGVPVSQNPVWNACVRGQGLSFDLIQSNRDRFEHRRGSLRITRPWTCRDYHRGKMAFWLYPDLSGVTVLLNRRGKLLAVLGDASVPRQFVTARKK